MRKIAVISASVREGRLSHRAALYVVKYVDALPDTTADLIDLKELGFPLFDERLVYQRSPSAAALDYARRIADADGVIVVSPVYNTSFPASLKNAVDLLIEEWVAKPVLVVSVTSGQTAGIATIQELQKLFLKLGARVTAPYYSVTDAATFFTEEGEPADRAAAERYSAAAMKEFFWLVGKSSE